MNKFIPHDDLVKLIRHSYRSIVENKQVSVRLKQLLPLRLSELRKKHYDSGKTIADATRGALSDPEYERFVEEYVRIDNEALMAKIQYETHMMLFNARRSLRAFHSK